MSTQIVFPSKQVASVQTRLEFSCLVSTAVNDLVYPDPNNDMRALSASDNNHETPIMGIVASKPTSTSCVVLFIATLTGLTTGRGTLFQGSDGNFSLSMPSTGYHQHLGFSFGNGYGLLLPNTLRIKL